MDPPFSWCFLIQHGKGFIKNLGSSNYYGQTKSSTYVAILLNTLFRATKNCYMVQGWPYKFLATSHLAPQLRFSRSQIFLTVAKNKLVGIKKKSTTNKQTTIMKVCISTFILNRVCIQNQAKK